MGLHSPTWHMLKQALANSNVMAWLLRAVMADRRLAPPVPAARSGGGGLSFRMRLRRREQ